MLFLGLLARMAAGAEVARPDDPVHFTPADKLAMMQLVRRTAAAGKPAPFAPDELPAKLGRSTGRPVFVTAHRVGHDAVVALREQGTLHEQLQGAALDLARGERLGPLAQVRFRIDLVGHVAPVGQDGLGFTGLPVLGIHGLHLRMGAKDVWLLPSEALRLDLENGGAFLRHALRVADLTLEKMGDAVVERFATTSFLERAPGGGGPPVDLVRGTPLVETVTRRRLLAAAEAGADWLLRFQKPDGSFHYAYNAATDQVEPGYNVVRHAGTAWSLAVASRALGHRRHLDGARRALDWLLRHAHTRDDLTWIEHDGHALTGTAALGLVALLEAREAERATRDDAAIRGLGRFLLFMQREDGFLWSEYDPQAHRGLVPEGDVPLYVQGQALLALVRLQRALPDPAWLRAATKAADFLAAHRDAWFAARGLEALPPDHWTLLAVNELHALGAARRTHADYALFVAKLILDEQETPETARWPDHVGAPRENPPRVTPTASRCEGLVAAWQLAERLGADPAEYRRAALASARFQLSHQYDDVNSHLLPNPARARGGFFSSYANHTTRIDSIQHNACALLGLAELLAREEP
jgi:hypothetical protein